MHKVQYIRILFIFLGFMVIIDPVCALSASELIKQCNDFYTKGDYKNALDCYNQSIALDDQNYYAWFNRGNAYYALDNVENAYQSYHRATEINPNIAMAWNGIGNTLSMMKRYNESVEAYNRAIAIAPDSPDAKFPYFGKGNALSALNNYPDAVEAYNQSILRDTKYLAAWNGKGNVLYQMGRYCDAMDSYKKALELNPNYESAKNNIIKAQEKCSGSSQTPTVSQKIPSTETRSIIPDIPDIPLPMIYSLGLSFLIISAIVISYSRVKQE